MTCKELMEKLVDFLGGDLVVEVRESVEVHMRGCAKCEVFVATYTQTRRLVGLLPKCGSLPAAFEARLRSALADCLGEKEKKAGGEATTNG